MLENTRTALVTDAHTGIGFAVARDLAWDGYTVIVHADSLEHGDHALERLVKGGVEPLRLDLVTGDFASLGEVARMARRISDTHPSLDLLVNTVRFPGAQRRLLTVDGHERTFQINYLAPFLLTRLLEGPLSKPGENRIVNASSTLHRGGSINWADPSRARRFTRHAAYSQACLAITMFTGALAEYWPAGTTAISVDPGTTDRTLLSLLGPRFEANHAAAEVVTQLTASDTTVVNGAFYDHLIPARAAAHVTDERSLRRLWKLSERLTGLR